MTALFFRAVASLMGLSIAVLASSDRANPVTGICSSDLAPRIDAIVNRPNFARSRVGILIQTLNTRQTLYSRDTDRLFIPASNVKILTTVAALRTLSPNYRIRTSVYGTQLSDGWKIRLVGRGDPSLNNRQLNDLAQQLKRRGINRIAELIVEDSYFGRDSLNPVWEVGDIQDPFAAPVSSLIFDQNQVGFKLVPQAIGQPTRVEWDDLIEGRFWRVDNQSRTVDAKTEDSTRVRRNLSLPILNISGQLPINSTFPYRVAIAIPNPDERFLRRFVRSLAETGITIKRSRISEQADQSGGIDLARIDSPPLSKLVEETNQNSNNLYAEVLLRTIGVQHSSNQTVLERGIETLVRELNRIGIDQTEIKLLDGSGISRQDLATPAAIVKVLSAIMQQPEGKYFRDSLPSAGISGTLQDRFKNSPAKGITRAKTGTLTGVSALSGYIDPQNYESLTFSILINQSPDMTDVRQKAIDEIVGLLASVRSCR